MKINKRTLFLLAVVLLVIAGLLDLKYQGLVYQILPESLQSIVTNIFT